MMPANSKSKPGCLKTFGVFLASATPLAILFRLFRWFIFLIARKSTQEGWSFYSFHNNIWRIFKLILFFAIPLSVIWIIILFMTKTEKKQKDKPILEEDKIPMNLTV